MFFIIIIISQQQSKALSKINPQQVLAFCRQRQRWRSWDRTWWRSRVATDPQFAFKVLMEELVGVTACVLGDMASRPNFGLNELDFVFSTLVVGSVLNFTLIINLVDLAGSEQQKLTGAAGPCLKQAGNISRSLSQLGVVS
ncbi:hypothetical protein CMV_021770 [Castanea mollissima]|uniref:Kinesin motor domain-containing protein n=1 Tax=Castanea mollissima TaxID=60419 RepID=A0A8J4QNE9_9ROSI|nr:hypothetical protein CMV_021770 [Castanea mollissima]